MSYRSKWAASAAVCAGILGATVVGTGPAQAEPGDWWTHDVWGNSSLNMEMAQAQAKAKATIYKKQQEDADLGVYCYDLSWDQGKYYNDFTMTWRYSYKIVIKCYEME